MRRTLRTGILAAVLALLPLSAAGQVVDGVVSDELTGTPLAGVTVILLDTLGHELVRAHSTDIGRFIMRAPEPGAYQIWADRLGYDPLLSRPLTVSGDALFVELKLTALPIALDEIRVTAEARQLALEKTGYYRRRELGIGRYIDLEQIERARPTRATDIVRMEPSVHLLPDAGGDGGTGTAIVFRGNVRGMGPGGARPCLPSLVVDGTLVRRGGPLPSPAEQPMENRPVRLDEIVHPSDILAMELYPSGAGVPAQWSGPDARCGVVVIWTKARRP